MPRKIVFTMVLYLINPQVSLGKVCVYRRGEEKVRGKKTEINIDRCTLHISPFDSHKCSKYHLPMILGSEFEVQRFKYSIYPLYASWSPYTAKGNVQFMNPINLS